MGFLVGELAQVVGRLLVDVVVEPVRVEQVGVGAPGDQGLLCGVVVGEVVARQGDGRPLALSRSYSFLRVSASYSACPVTKTCLPSREAARYTPASGETARISRSGTAAMSSARTSVWREWGR